MNEERLISKKEVLAETGISYGQLYRWKRKGLIPENWFIRRFTFTGQETFFPQEKIIERIERIKELKGDHPLDDLATLITKRAEAGQQIALSSLRNLGWLDEQLLAICHLEGDEEGVLSIKDTLCLGVLRQLEGVASTEELGLAKRTLGKALAEAPVEQLREGEVNLYLLHKRLAASGISAEISLVVIASAGATFDPGIEVVEAVDLGAVLERIKFDIIKEEG